MGLKGAGARLCLIEGLFSATRYAALMTGDGTGEQSGDNYTRVSMLSSVMALNSTTGQVLNNQALNFPAPGATWIDTTWAAIMSAATAGDVLFTMPHTGDPAAPTLRAEVGWATSQLSIDPPRNTQNMLVGGRLTLAGYLACMKGGLLAGTRYLSLHSGDPGTTRANEYSGGSYAAQAVTWNPVTPTDQSPTQEWTISTTTGLASLAVAKSFPVATTDLPDAMYVAICDALTAGNVLWSAPLPTTGPNNPDNPAIGDVLSIPMGGLFNVGIANDNDGI